MIKFKEMTLAEIRDYVNENPEDAKLYHVEIVGALADMIWDIGLLWDKVEGIDRSMISKLRRVSGFYYS